jgi:alkylresorcinol/alkylpyrone synthase
MDIRIAGLGTANPPLKVTQEEVYQAYVNILPLSDRAKHLLKRVFVDNQSIGTRYFAMDSLFDALQDTQDELIARYRRHAVPTAVGAASQALAEAGLAPRDVRALVVNTCTGCMCPGLTSYVAEALRLPKEVKPFDLQGMGCGGAIPNLETGFNLLHAQPGGAVLTVAVEMCTATVFFEEAPDILITNALFGDGAAASVLTSQPDDGAIRLLDFASGLYPEDRPHLHYRTQDSKLRNVLTIEVPTVGAARGKEVIDRLLTKNGLTYDDVDHWILHPGGERVLDALRDGLGLNEDVLVPSRSVLFDYGNMSSASVLFVLDEVRRHHTPRPGDLGVMCSFGAGFSAFATLIQFL